MHFPAHTQAPSYRVCLLDRLNAQGKVKQINFTVCRLRLLADECSQVNVAITVICEVVIRCGDDAQYNNTVTTVLPVRCYSELQRGAMTEPAKSRHGIISTIIKDVQNRTPLFKIKLAPLHVPPNRRLQTLAALVWILFPFIMGPLCWLFLLYLIFYTTTARYLALCYLLWMYIDKDSCERGGRRSELMRNLRWWEYYRDYFPVHLVKTTELAPDRNYLFAVYPHGILSSGAFAAFATNALHFDTLFKGLKAYVCTLKMNFLLPVLREYGLFMGMAAASQKSLNWILSSPGKGRAAILVVGGAAEALYNQPGVYKIVLKNRKGFCRVALQNGSPLVPVFSFGEIDLYDQLIPKENSRIDIIQSWIKRVTGVAPVIFFGRGVFNYSFGIVPRRVPVTVVVGKPIEVELIKNPTKDDIDTLHRKFMEGIVALFNEEKHKYLEDPETELIID